MYHKAPLFVYRPTLQVFVLQIHVNSSIVNDFALPFASKIKRYTIEVHK